MKDVVGNGMQGSAYGSVLTFTTIDLDYTKPELAAAETTKTFATDPANIQQYGVYPNGVATRI